MVPNGWKLLTFNNLLNTGDIEQIQDGNHGNSHPKSSDFVDEGIPFVMARDLKKGSVNLESCAYITKDQADSLRIGFAKPGDILLSHKGTIGQVAMVQDCEHYMMLTPQITYYRVAEKSKLLANFLYQFFLSHEFQGRLKNLAAQSTRSYLGITAQKKLSILLPPLPEQQKIAKILTTWDQAINTTERLIDNSRQQKKALMQQLLTGKKRLLDENGKRFEDEWKSQLFKKTLKLDRGSSPRPIVNYTTESEDGVNWIKIGDTKGDGLYINSTKEKITPEGAKKSRKVSKGEIILSNSMSYGKPYILNIDGYIHDGWFVIRDYEKHLDKSYLIQILSSELIQMQYKRLAAGGVVSNISSELVYSVKIDIPSIPEQQKIAAVLTNADKEIELLEQQLADLQQEKKALMQVLLTGKKRVRIDG